jgi:DNA (cytosine-5)-methyltransferase 1
MKSIELFAGAGGLGIGTSNAGFSHSAVIEWDKYCCDTIKENKLQKFSIVQNWPIFEGDVRQIDFKQFREPISLVSGGPPCQPFSLGGRHKAYDDSRDMFPQAIRAVRELAPKAFLFENVKGLTRQSFSNYLEYIKLQLNYPELTKRNGEDWLDHLRRIEQHHTSSKKYTGLSYNIVSRLLNAADYGVPQKRERIFIVGFRSDLGIEWAFPTPTHSNESLQWDQHVSLEYWERHKISKKERVYDPKLSSKIPKVFGKPQLLPWLTIRDSFNGLPDPEESPAAATKYYNHKHQTGAKTYPGHTGSPFDSPAKTLKAGAHGVPGGENMLVRTDGSLRYFSVRESARLQTFPDNYIFHGSWTETMRQLGNAVPVKLAEVVAKSVASQLSITNK